MLTPLQQRVRAIVAELPEADTVALAGGGALGVFDHHPRQAFPISDADYDQLRHWVHQWRNGLAESD